MSITHAAPRRQSTQTAAMTVQGTLNLGLFAQPDQPRGRPATAAPRGADIIAVSPALREEVTVWASTFVQASVEAILGDRPVSQLVRWTTTRIHDEITARASAVARAGQRCAGAPRRARVRPQVSSVHCCFIDATRVEVALVVRHAARSRCVAMRMEKATTRWQCTQIRFG